MRKALIALAGIAAMLAASDAAFAHRGGARIGVYVGPSWYWGPAWYYPPPYYYYYPPAQPAQPPVYVERIDPAEQGWWYYCEASRGYYPYVKECPAGWQRVSPTPPSQGATQ